MVIYHFFHANIDDFMNTSENGQAFLPGFSLLFSSYLIGHIISQISAYLDEWVYDPLKEIVYKDHKHIDKILEIRKEHYQNELNPVYVNGYKWSLYKLQKEYPEAIVEIDRYMADSKFFRSLFVVQFFLVVIFLFLPEIDIWLESILVLLTAFSMIRYFKKRRKATQTAYQYIIFSEELNHKAESSTKD